MSGIEYAAGERIPTRSSPFPPEWGAPPLDLEERARWTRLHAERAASRKRSTDAHAARARVLALRARLLALPEAP